MELLKKLSNFINFSSIGKIFGQFIFTRFSLLFNKFLKNLHILYVILKHYKIISLYLN